MSKRVVLRMLVLVVGPSGAGKDTLLNAARLLLADDARVRFAQREVTRLATPGGEDHLPIDAATFRTRRDCGAYSLWWEAHGLGYGIAAEITDDLARGITVVASVSRAVIAEAAAKFTIRVVEITAPTNVLAARLADRGREDAEDIARRLQRQVPLPDGIELVTVMNDGSIEEGAAKVIQAITAPAKATAPPT